MRLFGNSSQNQILDQTIDAVVSIDEKNRVTYYNAAAEKLWGYTADEVIGQNVKVSPAAVTHGSLTVTITEDPIVSQPGAFSNGQTAVVPRSRVNAEQEAKPMFKFGPGTTLDEIVRAVNQVGAAPGDLMAILEALKQAGALQADLIVI